MDCKTSIIEANGSSASIELGLGQMSETLPMKHELQSCHVWRLLSAKKTLSARTFLHLWQPLSDTTKAFSDLYAWGIGRISVLKRGFKQNQKCCLGAASA